ncbi:MAG TPA: hypothetical protein VN081_00930 [Dongiaceae bacterium]|nr:hypothetical protein [Dongiaceae bacterium]
MFLILIIFLIALIYARKAQKSTGIERNHYKAVAIVLFVAPIVLYLISVTIMVAYQGIQ